jgi:hypothetical protein
MRIRAVINSSAIVSAIILFPSAGQAYSTHDNWCDRYNLGWYRVDDSFAARGMDAGAAQADFNVAAAWWSEVQAGLRLTSSEYATYNSHDLHDPGEVVAVCNGDGSTDYATTDYAYAHYWSCDTFGANMDRWHMRVVSNLWGAESCGSSSQWALTRADVVSGKQMLYRVLAHEFGHVFGLGHSDDHPRALMNGPTAPNQTRLTNDDCDGIIDGQHEGLAAKPLKSTRAFFNSPYTSLSFQSPNQTVGTPTNLVWGPAISGNPAASSQGWDFAMAWVNTSRRIVVATAREDSNYNVQFVRTTTTAESTRNPVSVAVTPEGRIGVAWAGDDEYRTVNFMVSADGGATWSKGIFWGYSSLGGVALAYNIGGGGVGHFVMSWIHDSDDNTQMTQIIIATSDTATGLSWSNPKYVWGDRLSMQTNRPAIACPAASTNRCIMAFSSFADPWKGLTTQAMFYTGTGMSLWGDPQGIPWAVTYYNPNMLYIPASGNRPATYFALWEQWSVSPAPLTYALRYQSEGETGAFHNWGSWVGGPTSRSGFAAAYNYRTGALRFVWKEE